MAIPNWANDACGLVHVGQKHVLQAGPISYHCPIVTRAVKHPFPKFPRERGKILRFFISDMFVFFHVEDNGILVE